MEEIQDIVRSIVKGCNAGGVPVSEILAAFVAKTVNYFFLSFLNLILPRLGCGGKCIIFRVGQSNFTRKERRSYSSKYREIARAR